MSVMQFTSAKEMQIHRAALREKFRNLKVVPIKNSDKPVLVPVQKKVPGDAAVCGTYYGEIPQRSDGFELVAPQFLPTIIKSVVANFYGVTATDLDSARRQKNYVRARHVLFYLCKRLTLKSLPEIGRLNGNKDHTSVLHGVRSIEVRLTLNDELASEVEKITQQIEARQSARVRYRSEPIEILGA